ncbi:hypothetical protein HanRHA438_Chr02g0047481 [Helianthus annuus]|nr:hypothetical protein HanRHA438_Chr02g0047481 [Helianthus annuus]
MTDKILHNRRPEPVIRDGIDMIVMCMSIYSSTSCNKVCFVASYLQILTYGCYKS